MRELTFKGPYDLIAFKVIPALVEEKIIEPVSDEVILSYRPRVSPDRTVYRWTVKELEGGDLEEAEESKDSFPPGIEVVEEEIEEIVGLGEG